MDSGTTSIGVKDLLRFVQSRYGVDLSKYRPSCMKRRISHRLVMLKCRSLYEYMIYLQNHPDEIEHLLDVVTIHVTDFFRDHDVFDALFNKIIPCTVEKKLSSGQKAFRVWSAGCSTGEETYSIAIMLIDFLRREHIDLDVEVFGTDVSEESCRIAIGGVYPESKFKGVPDKIEKRYFKHDNSCYIVSPAVKRCVKFQVHDLFSPTIFSQLDFVVCRNVLIHFEQDARDDILSSFYSSLNNDGLLVLGKSEAVMGPSLKLFELMDPKSKVYRKKVLCASFKEE